MEKYDLTTKDGLQTALDVLESTFMFNPTIALIKYVIDKFTDLSKSLDAQQKAAEVLIRQGKENGVDDMEITMNNKRGFKLNVPIDEGVKIDTMIGSDEKMTIKVRYK